MDNLAISSLVLNELYWDMANREGSRKGDEADDISGNVCVYDERIRKMKQDCSMQLTEFQSFRCRGMVTIHRSC